MVWKDLPRRLEGCNIQPNTQHLHQYFLVDEEALHTTITLAEIEPDDKVLEIGAGVGNITELLAQEAKSVVAFEIDSRFRPFLDPLQDRFPNLKVCYRDIKRTQWPKFNRLVANIPFNVLEPTLPMLTQAKFRSAVLIVGRQFRDSVMDSFKEGRITKLAAVLHSFFLVEELRVIAREKFYPMPTTDAIIVELIPAIPRSPFLQFCRALFKNPTMLVEHVFTIHGASNEGRKVRKHNVALPIDIARKRSDRLSNSDLQRLFEIFSK